MTTRHYERTSGLGSSGRQAKTSRQQRNTIFVLDMPLTVCTFLAKNSLTEHEFQTRLGPRRFCSLEDGYWWLARSLWLGGQTHTTGLSDI